MSHRIHEPVSPSELRRRAVSKLSGRGDVERVGAGAAEALGVLHQLALSPSTASDALALLHELQVHQVELDLQAEELRASRAELESTLSRRVQLYDASPVASFTIDQEGRVQELNLTGARLLASERESVLGESLYSHLAPESRDLLLAMLRRVREGRPAAPCTLQVLRPSSDPSVVQAAVCADPGGNGFLVGLMELAV